MSSRAVTYLYDRCDFAFLSGPVFMVKQWWEEMTQVYISIMTTS